VKKQHIAIYNPYLETKGGGEKVCLAMAEYLSKSNTVTLISRKKIDLSELGTYFSLDLSHCKHEVLAGSDNFVTKVARRLHFPSRLNSFVHEFFDYRTLKKKNYDVFINNCYKSGMPCPAPSGVYMCMFPQQFNHVKDRFARRAYHAVIDIIELIAYGKKGLSVIRTYDHITVNSDYTKGWVKKLWGLGDDDVEILYPICEDMRTPNAKKEKVIMNVGRFFANSGENHYKCQDKLLDTFKEMTDLHEKGWRLVLAGSVAEDIDSLKYIIKLYESARDFPVDIITSAPFPLLKSYFAKSSIYWHATGWGSDPEKHPEKQEHFGITTVEAMSAGAVPIVIDTAGQKETLTEGKSGYRWLTKEQLLDRTRKVANDENLMNKLSKSAVTESKRYSKEAFEKSLAQILG